MTVEDTNAGSDAYELRHYVGIVRRRWLSIVIPALILAVAGFLIGRASSGMYESRARVLVQPTSPQSALTPGGGSAAASRALSANELAIMSSDGVLDAVEDAVGHDVDVSIRALDDDSNVAVVLARSDDRDDAERDAQTYVDTYVELRRGQLANTINQATSQIEGQIAELDTQIAALAQPVQDLDAQIIAELDPVRRNGLENQREELLTTRDGLQDRRTTLLQQVDQLRLAVTLNPTFGVEILANAADAQASGESTPRRYAIAAGALGLLLGLVLAFSREHFDDTVRAKRELERAVPGIPVVGLIPRARRRRSRPPAVLTGAKHEAAVEAFRKLRTSLQLAVDARDAKSVLIASANPAEGRTLTAANLAAALASTGKRIILIDGNLRRPRLHDVFGVGNEHGATSVLTNGMPVAEALEQPPGHPNLAVLTSGPPVADPASLLSTARDRVVLESCDLVIIDGPPVLPVTDALVLASLADAVLVLARAGETSASDVSAAVEQLEQSGTPVVGTILNGVDRRQAHVAAYRDRRYVAPPAGGPPTPAPLPSGSPAPAPAPVGPEGEASPSGDVEAGASRSDG
ncbi:MAG: polysaccharide biosynthesis tyrosine autokinase [Acidimicrobiales bacterium]